MTFTCALLHMCPTHILHILKATPTYTATQILVKKIKKQMFNILVPCLFIAAYPFVWYAVLKNHSFIHSFFTYRELAITLYAVLAFIAVYRAGGDA